MKKKVILVIVSICIIVGTFFGLQAVFQPKYQTSIFEGNFTESYYQSNYDHDVMVIGDCEVYENISPITMYEDYGLTSYIRGNAQQLTWQSYYMLKDALLHETPQVVVYSVTALRHGSPMSEAYNRMTLDGMKWSSVKWDAINASKTEGESTWDYLFPLLRYHSRWSELSSDDITYTFGSKKQTNFNGYLMKSGVEAYKGFADPKSLADYTLPSSSMSYLDKIRELCDENGITLVLMKSPNLNSPYWYAEWDEQIVNYANKYNLTYLNCIKLADEIGIDYSKDTYNGGYNLNVDGAEKVGSYLGKVFTEELKITSKCKNDNSETYWQNLIEAYYNTKDDQQYELETYGYLKSYGGTPKEGD